MFIALASVPPAVPRKLASWVEVHAFPLSISNEPSFFSSVAMPDSRLTLAARVDGV